MKIPKTYEMGGGTITVNRVTKIEGDNHGDWDTGPGIITIEKADKQTEWLTFCHELVHSIRDRYGLTLADDDAEERVVEATAQGFAQFLRSAK